MGVETLIRSHQRFKEQYGKKYITLFKELVDNGQSPKTLFISCSDSRVIPNLVTLTRPGDLFVTRNIGNFIPPFDPECECSATPAVIEYALVHLNVENIIVCGHTDCGACKALYHDIPDGEEEVHLKRWLRFGEGAKNQAVGLVGTQDQEALLRATEKFNVIEQLKNLLTYPAVKRKVEEGDVFVQGWYYHTESGNLEYFNPSEYRFLPIEESIEPSGE